MRKICFILLILSSILSLSESINYNSIQRKFYSKLIGMVRTEIIYNSLPYLKNLTLDAHT